MKLSVSFFKSNYSKEETIDRINKCNYDGYLHVDVCDGKYVSSEETNLKELVVLLKKCNKPLDIHLMVNNPLAYINILKYLKPEIISVHVSCKDDLFKVKEELSLNNIKMGLVINPDEEIYEINKYLDIINLVLIMSVYPGKGGQKFIPSIPYKLEHLKKLRDEKNNNFIIHVDGGINKDTIKYIRDYVDMFVCGSYICCSDDYQAKIDSLLETTK